MRAFLALVAAFLSLASCETVLREPALDLQYTTTETDVVEFKVVEVAASQKSVQEANKDKFVRYVNVFSSANGFARRVDENSLFSGKLPVSNKKPVSRLSAGDTIVVSRVGFEEKTTGVASRNTLIDRYILDENGSVYLKDVGRVFLSGLTKQEANDVVSLVYEKRTRTDGSLLGFPSSPHQSYQIGVGDVVRISRMVDEIDSEGVAQSRISSTKNTVSSAGTVSVLQLGELEIADLTLPEARALIVLESLQTASELELLVELEEPRSQSVLMTGEFGTTELTIGESGLNLSKALSALDLPISEARDFSIELKRADAIYEAQASEILQGELGANFFLTDKDLLTIKSILPSPEVSLEIESFESKTIAYYRAKEGDQATHSLTASLIPFGAQGLDLRNLLISQTIDLNKNTDLLIRLIREEKEYRLSAQRILFGAPNVRYWLQADDFVIVEDIPYVGENAMMVGELRSPRLVQVNRNLRTSLSDALFQGELFSTEEADFRHVYLLRGARDEYKAYHFDLSQVPALSLVQQTELRPGDIIFVRRRPISNYNRVLAMVLTFVGSLDAVADRLR